MVGGRGAAGRPDPGVRPDVEAGRAQSAAYPFTRLRADGVWTLDRDVPMDNVSPLREGVTGRLEASLEAALLDRPELLDEAARGLVKSHSPRTVAPDVLVAVGLDPDLLEGRSTSMSPDQRRRSGAWPAAVIAAWDWQCAFCGFDGAAGEAVVGIEAAHVRWFKLGGPDDLDNGLALCSLHHSCSTAGCWGWTTTSPSWCPSGSPPGRRRARLCTTCTGGG